MKEDEYITKIFKAFHNVYPQFIIMKIYDCDEGTIIRAQKDPDAIESLLNSYYQYFSNGMIINAKPIARQDWFNKVVQEENKIYDYI